MGGRRDFAQSSKRILFLPSTLKVSHDAKFTSKFSNNEMHPYPMNSPKMRDKKSILLENVSSSGNQPIRNQSGGGSALSDSLSPFQSCRRLKKKKHHFWQFNGIFGQNQSRSGVKVKAVKKWQLQTVGRCRRAPARLVVCLVVRPCNEVEARPSCVTPSL